MQYCNKANAARLAEILASIPEGSKDRHFWDDILNRVSRNDRRRRELMLAHDWRRPNGHAAQLSTN